MAKGPKAQEETDREKKRGCLCDGTNNQNQIIIITTGCFSPSLRPLRPLPLPFCHHTQSSFTPSRRRPSPSSSLGQLFRFSLFAIPSSSFPLPTLFSSLKRPPFLALDIFFHLINLDSYIRFPFHDNPSGFFARPCVPLVIHLQLSSRHTTLHASRPLPVLDRTWADRVLIFSALSTLTNSHHSFHTPRRSILAAST